MSGAADRLLLLPDHAPIRLRRIGRDQALVETALARPMHPLTLSVGGRDISLSIGGAVPANATAPWVHLTVAGAPAALQASWGQLRNAAALVVEGGDPADIALCLEEAVSAWLDRAEELGCPPLRLLSVEGAPPTDAPILRSLELSRTPHPTTIFPLALSEAAARHIATLRDTIGPAPLTLDALPVRIGLELEATTLSLAVLRSLAVGDAIRLADTGARPAPRLRAEDHWVARAMLHDRGVELTGPWVPLHETSERPFPMSDDTTAPADAGPAPTLPDADAIEVRLSFRAGETLLPLARLRELGPGAVVDLPQTADASVDILANGRAIGTGELIDVAGQRAVQIKTLFS